MCNINPKEKTALFDFLKLEGLNAKVKSLNIYIYTDINAQQKC